MRVAGQPHTRCRSVTSTHHVVQRVLGDRGYAPAKLTRTVAGGCAAGWCGRGVAREPPTPGTRARWRPGTPRVTWARTTASDAHSAKQSADAQASDLPVGVPHARFVGPGGTNPQPADQSRRTLKWSIALVFKGFRPRHVRGPCGCSGLLVADLVHASATRRPATTGRGDVRSSRRNPIHEEVKTNCIACLRNVSLRSMSVPGRFPTCQVSTRSGAPFRSADRSRAVGDRRLRGGVPPLGLGPGSGLETAWSHLAGP